MAEDLIAEHLEAAQREDAPPTELSTLAPRQPSVCVGSLTVSMKDIPSLLHLCNE